LEIGAGTLEMGLDSKFEERIDFWSDIWRRLPTTLRLKTSPTWTNPMLYKKKSINADGSSEKQEL
jgi:hypothetical protein